MNRFINKRTIWTLSRGNSIGFVERIFKSGIIFSTDFVKFRETSSNLSNGEAYEISITLLSDNDRKILESCMNKKIPVCVEYYEDLIGSPLRGHINFPTYIVNVKSMNDEIINVKEATN